MDERHRQEKLAFRISEAVAASGLGRSTIFDLIKVGKLKALKAAGRRLIMREDLEAYLRSCRDS